jgi:hypothetical protein
VYCNVGSQKSWIDNLTGAIFDCHRPQGQIGTLYTDVSLNYVQPGAEATAVFVGSNPNNNYAHMIARDEPFAWIVSHEASGDRTISKDSEWDLTFSWERSTILPCSSFVTVTWDIPDAIVNGTFSIHVSTSHHSIF